LIHRITLLLILLASPCVATRTVFAQIYNITDFGARGDGKTMSTGAIQRAIEACAKTGGTVLVPGGTFLSGTLLLKSNVTLHLAPGAILKGSPSPADYPAIASAFLQDLPDSVGHDAPLRSDQSRLAFLFGEDLENVTIEGRGTLHGNGDSTGFGRANDNTRRPILLYLINCRNVLVRDITMRNSVFWNQYYLHCDGVRLSGLRVDNLANFNNDGIDIESRNVTIDNCTIDCDDDAICLKSNYYWPVENVIITNCNIGTNCNGIKTGTASLGGFKNITIANCVIHQASVDHLRFWSKSFRGIAQPRTVLAGIALEVVDGGTLENVSISNIAMTHVQTPLFIRLGDRGRKEKVTDPERPKGYLRDVTISNVTASSYSHITSSITGVAGRNVENLHLSNIIFNCLGKGTAEEAAAAVPEREKDYPENRMYGWSLPAYGLYVRHAEGISLQNVRFTLRNPDERPALRLEATRDVILRDVTAAPSGTGPVRPPVRVPGPQPKGGCKWTKKPPALP
jgi:polygalacturonase